MTPRRRLAAVALAGAVVAMAAPGPALAHGGGVDVVVEALIRPGSDPIRVDYGIALRWDDGDAIANARVTLAAADGPAPVPEATAPQTTDGVYIGELFFPESAAWRVRMAFESPETAGSVEFTEDLTGRLGPGPFVRVDTADPSREGRPATDVSAILPPSDEVGPAPVNTGAVAVVTEAFVADEFNPLFIQYTVALTAAGAPLSEATVRLSATSAAGLELPPIELSERLPGLYRGDLTYPDGATYALTLSFASPGGEGDVEFGENLPWPHYTTEAGTPKVKVDTVDPDRVGMLVLDSTESIYRRAEAGRKGEEAEAPPADSIAAAQPSGSSQVVLDLPSPAEELSQDIILRVTHAAAIGAWAIGALAFVLGRQRGAVVALAAGGAGATIATGMLLVLWGAPLRFPGLFRWSDLSARLYGPSYQVAFGLKMFAVAVAAGATAFLIRRRSRTWAWATLAFMSLALVAFTAMSQFHLFSHL